jgi:succinate-semialdehyde dehydrogenase/glutarate-semialdehyde dehydrogenase
MTATSTLPATVGEPGLLIGGAWCPAADGATFAVTDPATGALVASVPDATDRDLGAAIDAAADALPAWRATPAIERARILRRAADIVRERGAEIAETMTREQGKPLVEAHGEVEYAAGFLEWFGGEAERVYGQVVPSTRRDTRTLVLRQPVGVTAAITPWNFPAAMLTRKLGPALAAGCTSICKPASATPLTAMAICRAIEDAGAPAGVVNFVTTRRARAAAAALFADARVRKLSFTGSTEVGRELIRLSADGVKRLSLELGGHAPFIVFDDADLDAAVTELVACKFRNAGQACISVNRVYAQRGIAGELAERLATAVAGLHVGSGLDATTQVGPLIDVAAVDKVAEHVDDAVARGASLLVGGERLPQHGTCFYAPTLITDVTPAMLVSHEETFGPLLAVASFDGEDEVIARANDTEYGLAAYFHTRDYARLLRVAERLDFGIVGANDGRPSSPSAPFGGVKASGYGREGGAFGIDEYLDVKYVSIGAVA